MPGRFAETLDSGPQDNWWGDNWKKNPGKNSDLGAGSDAGQVAVRSSC